MRPRRPTRTPPLAAACRGLALAACVGSAPAPAAADTLVLTSGRVLEGKVLQQDERGVVFESFRHGARLRQSVPAARVASVRRTAREGVPVAVVPLIGGIGLGTGTADQPAVTPEGLAEALRVAKEEGAERVVLVVDSPGGRIDEMERILTLLLDPGLPPVTAYARRALSAAAVIALACDELVVSPSARLGAAVPLRFGPDGTPQNIEAKARSSYEALLRRAARAAGRDPGLLLAMADDRVVLHRVDTPEGPRLTREPPSEPSGEPFKPAGDVLTLNAEEAVRFGVARARADAIGEVPAAVGVPAWHSVGHRPWEEAGRVNAAAGHALGRARRRAAGDRFRLEVSPAVAAAREAVAERERALQTLRRQRETLDASLEAYLAQRRGPSPSGRQRRSRRARGEDPMEALARREHAAAAAELDAATERIQGQLAELRTQLRRVEELEEAIRG